MTLALFFFSFFLFFLVVVEDDEGVVALFSFSLAAPGCGASRGVVYPHAAAALDVFRAQSRYDVHSSLEFTALSSRSWGTCVALPIAARLLVARCHSSSCHPHWRFLQR